MDIEIVEETNNNLPIKWKGNNGTRTLNCMVFPKEKGRAIYNCCLKTLVEQYTCERGERESDQNHVLVPIRLEEDFLVRKGKSHQRITNCVLILLKITLLNHELIINTKKKKASKKKEI